MAEEQTGAEPAAGGRAVGATVRTLASSLWFPAFFFTGFLVCYLLPFHNPTPHHVGVAVTAPAADQVQQVLDAGSPGAFDVQAVPDARAAQDAVTGRDVSAAYVPGSGTHHLYVAKADGYSLEVVLQKTFTAVGKQAGAEVQMHDLAPTAPGDGMGTGLFYLVLACTIPSYIMVMMLLRAAGFDRRQKITTLVVAGAVMSLVGYVVGRGLDVLPGEPLAILFLFLLTQAVSLVSYGLVPFCKQFFPGVAMGLFVLLSMPSSSGAIPVQMVPGFFRALHPVMPMGNVIEALRGQFYFGGVEVWRHVLVVCAWVLAGVVLLALGAWRERRIPLREEAEEAAGPPVDDPAFELPEPSALPPHGHRLGQGGPVLTGRVTGEAGEPLRGVAITVTGTHGSELVRATTDANGEYAATGLPEHFVNVIASAPDRPAAVSRVQVRDGCPVHQDFRLASRPQWTGAEAAHT